MQSFTSLSLSYFLLCISIPCFSQIFSPFIHLDQFGYLTEAEKVAVISNPQEGYNMAQAYQVGNELELRHSETGNIVFSAMPQSWNNGNTHSQSGDAGWWFDFSELNTTGSYYVYDPSTDHRSVIFEINANPYREVIRAATKAFYYNRSGFSKEEPFAGANWVDDNNFLQDTEVRSAFDQDNPDSARDMSGGWFDAGDYNKYVTFAHHPVHQLLTSYEDNPSLFTDDWNLPESGDGLPDILNEIQWELDWLYKMVNADGTVYIKMGSLDYDINDAAPPSNNNSPRYYAPTCSSASLAVASMTAHASKVFRQFPSLTDYAQVLEDDALLCWNRFIDFYDNDNLETNCDDMTVKAGDADWDEQNQINNAIVAASYLFDITSDETYSNFIRDNIGLTTVFDNEFWSPELVVLLEAMLNYTTHTNANPQVVAQINNSVITAVNNDWGNYFDFSTDDLYRATAPDWVYYWGSNMAMANIGNLCQTILKYNVLPTANEGLLRKSEEQIHYFHGINPQGMVYLSNMYAYGAERSANEIAHTWFIEGSDWDNALTSLYGPAPGFLSGGPNQAYTGALTPPANQPIQKSYLDYNDWFTDPAYEITEPAIYYQAAYIQLLSNFTSDEVVTENNEIDDENTNLHVFPNPFEERLNIHGIEQGHLVKVFDPLGILVHSFVANAHQKEINLDHLVQGVYLVSIYDSNQHVLFTKKVIKMK